MTRYIYYHSNADGMERIWWIAAGAAGKPEEMFRDAPRVLAFSPANRSIYFQGIDEGVRIDERYLFGCTGMLIWRMRRGPGKQKLARRGPA